MEYLFLSPNAGQAFHFFTHPFLIDYGIRDVLRNS